MIKKKPATKTIWNWNTTHKKTIRPPLSTMWVQGLIQSLVGLFLFIPSLIFIMLYLEAFTRLLNDPISIILFAFTTLGLVIVFPLIQAFWIEMFKQNYKDCQIIDIRFTDYKKKKSVLIKI